MPCQRQPVDIIEKLPQFQASESGALRLEARTRFGREMSGFVRELVDGTRREGFAWAMRPHLLLLLLLAAGPAAADDKNPIEQFADWVKNLGKPPPPPKPAEPQAWNIVTLNPLALQQEQLGIEYERVLGAAATIYIAPQAVYGSAGSSWVLSAGGNLGMRFYVLGAAPNGIFIGPEVGVNFQRAHQNGVHRRAFGIGVGAGVGLSLVFFERFAVSVGFAAQYRSVADIESPEPETVRTRFSPLPRLAFGVAF